MLEKILTVRQTQLEIIQGDITELDIDAIVNPANGALTMEAGLAAVLKKKGGELIEQQAQKKAPLFPGEAIITGGNNLKCKYVIHAVTVNDNGKTDEHTLRRACANAFQRAVELDVSSLALPGLGCGVGGFPVAAAAKIIAQEFVKFARLPDQQRGTLQSIILCLLDKETFHAFEKTITGYINHILNDLSLGPYVTVDIIIERPNGIVFIERSSPPFGWALPGGFVDVGESLEEAAMREAKEETGLDLVNMRQMHTYSAPDRDPRFHTVSTVFVAQGQGTPRFGDDAKGLTIVPYAELLAREYAFDHRQIIVDYIRFQKNETQGT